MARVEEIKHQAVLLMAEKGFEAMSLRQLAAAVGMRAGSIYAHYQSKAQLLLEVCCDYQEDLLSVWLEQRELRPQRVEEMLLRFAAVYLGFCYARAAESRVFHLDCRSLDDRGRALVAELREQYEAELESILRQGVMKGAFHLTDLRMARLAIVSLLQGFCGVLNDVDPTVECETFEACAAAILRLVGVRQCDKSKTHALQMYSEIRRTEVVAAAG